MCITIDPADLLDTILLAHSTEHEGTHVNVIGYQNQAKNKSRSPNAMVLPFPSAEPMTQKNCIDMSGHPNLLKRYAGLVRPRARSLTKSLRSVQVFDSGSYTVVLAATPTDIPSVIEQVPENKRPRLHPELFDAFATWYPGWPVALCCWDGRIEAEPLLWWYQPRPEFQDRHFLPSLDGHDGRIPNPSAPSVLVDHTLIIGSHRGPSVPDVVVPNAQQIQESVSSHHTHFFPSHVHGGKIKKQMKNGDWVLPKDGWNRHTAANRLNAQRQSPPGVS